MPCRASSADSVSPTGPPPAINTGTERRVDAAAGAGIGAISLRMQLYRLHPAAKPARGGSRF